MHMAPMVTDSCVRMNELMVAFSDNMDYSNNLSELQINKNERLLNAHSKQEPDMAITERYNIKLTNYEVCS